MPPSVVSSNVVICERLIVDKDDDVPSAIRILDAIYIGGDNTVPLSNIQISFAALITIKLATDTPLAKHNVSVQIISPSGKIVGGLGPAPFDPEPPRSKHAPLGL